MTAGRSVGKTNSIAASKQDGRSSGWSEAFRSVYKELPTSVHSKENVLYVAAQTLRALPTGTAFINYVGEHGMNSGMLRVPRRHSVSLSEEEFNLLRERVFRSSPSALPTAEAQAQLGLRKRKLIAAATALRLPPPEPNRPEEFRVPIAKGMRGRR